MHELGKCFGKVIQSLSNARFSVQIEKGKTHFNMLVNIGLFNFRTPVIIERKKQIRIPVWSTGSSLPGSQRSKLIISEAHDKYFSIEKESFLLLRGIDRQSKYGGTGVVKPVPDDGIVVCLVIFHDLSVT